MKKWLAIFGLVILGNVPVYAADQVKIESFTLKNGMEVVVLPNPRVPAVSHMIWFRIGSADEQAGMSGLAHYLEHMMFKGTRKLKVGEYSQIVSAHGGNHNAFTSRDFTAYYVNIAKANLPLIMQMEADRMVNLHVDEKEFLKEQQVIMEERSMRTDNNPTALLAEQMDASLYLNHPYHHPVIGWRQEMAALTRDQVFAMYHRYYHPNNAILVVAGDITAKELKPLAEKYYGKLPKGDAMVRHWTEEPQHMAARRVEMQDAKVKQPTWYRSYLAPSFVHGQKDQAMALTLLAEIMGGKTGRLYQHLVVEQKKALNVDADFDGVRIGYGEFSLSALPAENVSLSDLEALMEKEILNIQMYGVTKEELTRAKTLSKADIIYARDGLQGMAYVMGMLRAVGLDAEFFNKWPESIDAVTEAQVQAAAKAVLKDKQSVTGWLLPPALPVDAPQKEAQHAK